MGYKITKVPLNNIRRYRNYDIGSKYFFMTKDGDPLTRDRSGKTVYSYIKKAGITGKRVHLHFFQATKAALFLRSGGDSFSRQKCLGYTTLTITLHYSVIADADVKATHLKYRVIDKLSL
jgi:site-specific recombinase XerD